MNYRVIFGSILLDLIYMITKLSIIRVSGIRNIKEHDTNYKV
jgi:hypothetical protein